MHRPARRVHWASEVSNKRETRAMQTEFVPSSLLDQSHLCHGLSGVSAVAKFEHNWGQNFARSSAAARAAFSRRRESAGSLYSRIFAFCRV